MPVWVFWLGFLCRTLWPSVFSVRFSQCLLYEGKEEAPVRNDIPPEDKHTKMVNPIIQLDVGFVSESGGVL